MEATVREMPHMVDREVLEVSNNKINSLYEEPLASAQRKRWLNSIDFNPVGPFCAIACGQVRTALQTPASAGGRWVGAPHGGSDPDESGRAAG